MTTISINFLTHILTSRVLKCSEVIFHIFVQHSVLHFSYNEFNQTEILFSNQFLRVQWNYNLSLTVCIPSTKKHAWGHKIVYAIALEGQVIRLFLQTIQCASVKGDKDLYPSFANDI